MTLQKTLERLRQNDATLVHLSLSPIAVSDKAKFNIIGLPEADFVSIADALSHNNTVTSLNCRAISYGNKHAVKHMIWALRNNQSITSVNLSANKTTEEDILALSNVLLVNSTLTNLNLSHSKINSKKAQYLSGSMTINRTLTNLDLSENEMHLGHGIASLIDMLRTNTTLTNLNLSQNTFTSTNTHALMEALAVNNTLISLNLNRCSIEFQHIYDNRNRRYYDLLCNNKTLLKLDGIKYDREQKINQYIQRNARLYFGSFIEFGLNCLNVFLQKNQVDLTAVYHHLNLLEPLGPVDNQLH